MNDITEIVRDAEGDCGGYIYVGLFAPAVDVLFVKCGETECPTRRARQYGTMLPGGLDSMHAVYVPDPRWCESVLMKCVAALDGSRPVGGEWFKFSGVPFARDKVLDALASFGGKLITLRVQPPPAFGDKKVRRYKRNRRLL